MQLGRIEDDQIHLSKIHFSLIDELVFEIDNEEVYKELWEKKQKLLNFKQIPSVALPQNIEATLRQYQEEGYKWIHFLDEFAGEVALPMIWVWEKPANANIPATAKEPGSKIYESCRSSYHTDFQLAGRSCKI